MKDKYFDN